MMPKQRDAHGIMTLPIDEGSMSFLAALPTIHRDPFDRILIAQALRHGLTLVSVDGEIAKYRVALLASDGPALP